MKHEKRRAGGEKDDAKDDEQDNAKGDKKSVHQF